LVGRAERDGIRSLADVPAPTLVELLAASDDVAARALGAEPGAAVELLRAATVERSLAAADVIGGTAPTRVRAAIVAARARLDGSAT
jgi:hypothetical protein